MKKKKNFIPLTFIKIIEKLDNLNINDEDVLTKMNFILAFFIKNNFNMELKSIRMFMKPRAK